MTVIIVGLGPGDPALLTRQAEATLRSAGVVYARTGRHAVCDYLRAAGVTVSTFDAVYERAESLPDVYAEIARRLIALDDQGEGRADIVYAAPGHPWAGEATTPLLLDWARRAGRQVRLVEGLAFIEPALTLVGADALEGLQIAAAHALIRAPFPLLDPDRPALIAQVESREVAGDLKLTLGALYPDAHAALLILSPGTPEAETRRCALFELDRQGGYDHLTCLYLPASAGASSWLGLQSIVAQLRAPGGCPWDREQTHRTLRAHLLDEAYEVLDALDREDSDDLRGELGDLALQIALHCQIALEEGEFGPSEVFAGIIAKLRRRHPHVFGDVKVADAGEVLVNWEEIKRQERGARDHRRQFEGVPASLPALAQALTYQERAARVGYAPDAGQKLAGRCARLESGSADDAAWGDFLFAAVDAARRAGVNPESALREANARFAARFAAGREES
jgi:tetrapyrrole methylase family protein/MazG family protein